MDAEGSDYRSFLLRMWRVGEPAEGDSDAADAEPTHRPVGWRASLECTRTGCRTNFSTLEELFAFIRSQAAGQDGRANASLIGLLCGMLLAVVTGLLLLAASNSARSNFFLLPPRSGGAITVSADGQVIVAVNPDSNTVSLVSAASLTVTAEISVGAAPQNVILNADGTTAYVSNKEAGSVSVIDLVARRVTDEIAVGDRPVGLALSPDGRFLAVAETGADRVRFLETATLRTVSVVSVNDRPYDLDFTPDGEYLLIAHLLSGQVTVLAVQPYTSYLPVQLSATAGFPRSPTQHLLAPAADPFIVPTWPQIAPAPAVVVNAAGTRAYLAQTMANGQGLNTQFDNSVFPKVSVLNLSTWTHQTSEHISLPETDQPVGLPWDVALAKNDSELWVVNGASNDVSIVDISNPTLPIRRAHLRVEDNPRGIAFSPDGLTAYVNNTLAGTVSVIDAGAYAVTTVIPVTDIPLPPLLLNGKQLFHSSARPELSRAAWISCNTCHIEGENDGRTWLLQFLGEIPPGGTPIITRNTTSLLGMIQTYPLRWSAEWDESADSEFSIRFEGFGTGLINGEMHPTLGPPNQGRSYDLDCLAAFIDSLPIPERSHTLTAAEQRGEAVFFSPQTECAACHPPPLYTDLQRHDVGTADAAGEWFGPDIDTPTLRFLYDSAPYLHDGSADTVMDVLTTKNPADEHGITSQLTAQELADLAAYLLALPDSPAQE